MNANRFPRAHRWLALIVLLGGVALLPRTTAPAADHRDGPIFPNTAVNGQQDINDIYVFRSPANANNTVFVFTFQPFPGNLSPATIDPATIFDLHIDTNGDFVEDLTFRFTVGQPDMNGVQDVTVRALPSTKFPPTGIVARGKTGTNAPVTGGGMFRAGIHDDPFFFDAGSKTTGGFADLVEDGVGNFPRPKPANPMNPMPNEARNFFGPNGNTMAFIVEIPSVRLAPNATIINVWVTSTKNNVQVDRMGRPAINTALIPPVPRNVMPANERRNAFNAGLPRNDVRDFKANMVSVLQTFYGRTAADATAITGLLLPDVIRFEIGNPNGFGTFLASGTILGNGRRLSDDVIDFELGVLTNGAITTDNVGDDNGMKVTDGSVDPVSGMTRPIAFPYIGLPNQPFNGPGTGPNP
jgi:hypothetical protein